MSRESGRRGSIFDRRSGVSFQPSLTPPSEGTVWVVVGSSCSVPARKPVTGGEALPRRGIGQRDAQLTEGRHTHYDAAMQGLMASGGPRIRGELHVCTSSKYGIRVGTLDVAIPKLPQGSYFPEWLLERPQRAERALTSVVAACYLLGVSTQPDGQAGGPTRDHHDK